MHEGSKPGASIIKRLHARCQKDSPARACKANIEFHVLAASQLLVERADAVKDLAPPAAAEYGIHPAWTGLTIAGSEVRIPNAKTMRQRDLDGSSEQSLSRDRMHRAAHVVCLVAIEVLDGATQIIRRDGCMRV